MASVLSALAVILSCFGIAAGEVMCNPNFCLNDGVCSEDPPGGCICSEDFAGFYCEIVLTGDETCVPTMCLNGGYCDDDAIVCTCLDGYTGYFCETKICLSDTDCNGGECRVNETDAELNVCTACQPGYAGLLCEHPFGEFCGMMEGVCLNGGTCFRRPINPGFTCDCMTDYTGPQCDINRVCSPVNPCRNGGECVNEVCQCVDMIRGALCEIACMSDADCMNGAVCLEGGSCDCPDRFIGARCGIASCVENSDCLNGGTCNAEEECLCADNYSGGHCEIAATCADDAECLNGGNCNAAASACVCINGYSGPKCQNWMCLENRDCLNGGSCIQDGVCKCVADFSGSFCEKACFEDRQCRNGGHCEDSGMCECVNGYTGTRCEGNPVEELSVAVIAVSIVGGIILLVLIIIVVLLLRKRLIKRRHRRTEGGQLELGTRSPKKTNDYIGVNRGDGPDTARRPNGTSYEPDGKEFPREQLHVMEQLGAGSFATVHRAEAEGIIKNGVISTVAVKMLKTTATDGDKSDFEKERSMYRTLGYHPNVVSMLGYCTEKEPFFLIMEYLPNGNLQTYLRHIRTGAMGKYFELKEETKRNYLIPSEIISFASQIANGMEFLASKSCIHRDLATRNILLADDLVAKVSDFGLSRDVQDSSQYEMKSKSRVPVRWMAPESLLDNIYTSKSDVWGFAVLLWELVTLGSHPYPGMSSKQVMEEIKAGYRLPQPQSCSDEIYDMMKRCWNEQPKDRPTFTEICKILDNMMADASGYLVMSELNRDDYLYLEPNQTKSVNTADDF